MALHAIIHGRVQGVYFRDFVKHHARGLGIRGWVRNRYHDGTVEVQAEGDRESLERLLEQLHRGPPSARVDRVEAEWQPYSGVLSSFTVRW